MLKNGLLKIDKHIYNICINLSKAIKKLRKSVKYFNNKNKS